MSAPAPGTPPPPAPLPPLSTAVSLASLAEPGATVKIKVQGEYLLKNVKEKDYRSTHLKAKCSLLDQGSRGIQYSWLQAHGEQGGQAVDCRHSIISQKSLLY